ncbi:glucans biosynthesis glucosyltransferase MdoH, partial [Desulfovibrio sp. OttesenSCG-928-A18]|nr:glucans biosynthesis glucosyltransferase MdoH [Desulfovibrio sp. OttesenSCG-928-A18]
MADMPKHDLFTQKNWMRAGRWRRLLLLILILGPALFCAAVMHSLLPAKTWPAVNAIITALFAVLFAWISVGFWSAVAGVFVLLKRYDRFAVTLDCPDKLAIAQHVRTALLFPVYNEDARQVSEGIRTVLHSLRANNLDRHFDIFILSDTTNPEIWVQEEEAWFNLCRSERAFQTLFYRRRKSNLKRKSGNIADFCRRWGANYQYMVVFDADSLMAGETLCRMVQAMEAHPEIGILQTPPKAVRSRSLIARVQQFANHLYGPMFAAGFHFWQLGEAQYWGHNAIIRVEPFMRHCQLPTLPGSSFMGGEILSHDFVESALMRRAGYGVWLAYELQGSWEENPPSLIDELIRDRRWCQGNLQHTRLIFTRGFFPTHRALFINGIMSYGSALLWFFFLLASSAQAISQFFIIPDYFPPGRSLFPDWPQYFPTWALSLLGGTACLLFIPKILALLLVMGKRGTRAYGGFISMSLSCLGEVALSTVLAPTRMLFHSYFVVATLLGIKVGWKAQNRGEETSWKEALRFHWWGTLLGLLWGLLMYITSPGFFIWFSPIVTGLAISIPLSVWTSRVSVGDASARAGLFLTPAQTGPAPELAGLEQNLARAQEYCPFGSECKQGFVRAVVVPRVFALHSSLLQHKRRNSAQKTARLRTLVRKALELGPPGLNAAEKNALLSDPGCLKDLHLKVWALDEKQAALWGI